MSQIIVAIISRIKFLGMAGHIMYRTGMYVHIYNLYSLYESNFIYIWFCASLMVYIYKSLLS